MSRTLRRLRELFETLSILAGEMKESSVSHNAWVEQSDHLLDHIDVRSSDPSVSTVQFRSRHSTTKIEGMHGWSLCENDIKSN